MTICGSELKMSSLAARLSRRSFCASVRNVTNVESLKRQAEQGAHRGDIGQIVKSIRAVQNLPSGSFQASSSNGTTNVRREKHDSMRMMFRSALAILTEKGDAKTASRTFKAMQDCKLKPDDISRRYVVEVHAKFAQDLCIAMHMQPC